MFGGFFPPQASTPQSIFSLSALQWSHCALHDGCPVSMILKALPFPSGGIKETVVLLHYFHVCMKQSLKDLGVLDVLGIMTGVV